MQETWVRSVVPEDPTYPGATKRVHNYWACAPEPRNHNYRAYVLQLLKSVHPRARASRGEKPPQWEARTWQLQPPLIAIKEKPAQ